MKNALTFVAAVLGASGQLRGEVVSLASVSGSFDQGAPYTIDTSIDGVRVGNGSGWGVFGGQTAAQTAVYTAAAPVSASEIAFTLVQVWGGGHHIQEFRISTTTDAVPDVNGMWTPVTATSMKATGGPTLSDEGDSKVRATGATDAGFAVYQIVATASVSNVTGFLLEVFPYDSGGGANLGASNNGNFVLTEFIVATDGSINRALGALVVSSEATWPGFPPSNITDGNFGNLTHPTGPGGPAPSVTNPGYYFEVDLGESFALSEIQLVPRQDGCCPERLSDYTVQILDDAQTQVWSGDFRTDLSDPGQITEVIGAGDGAGTFAGRYVRIVNRNGADYNPQLGEAIVLAASVTEPLRIIDFVFDPGSGNGTVTFTAIPNAVYSLFGSFDLENWVNIDDFIQADGDEIEFDFFDQDLVGAVQRFYYVEEND